MAMLRYGHAAVSTPVVAPGKWLDKKVPAGRVKVARSMIARYDPSKWLLSHVTIIASVDVDLANPKDPKSNYLIIPEHSQFVNNNGDCWERNLLRSTYKTFLNADNYCFPGGTRVLMSDGTYKPIEDVREGDKVINRKGEIGKVKKLFQHDSTDLVAFESKGLLSRKLYTTPNHPFWVYKARKTCPKTGRPNFFNKDKDYYLLDNWRGFSAGVHCRKGESYPIGLSPDWEEASDIDISREFFTHPVSSVEKPNEEINENRAELIGWFLAEGYYMDTNASSDEESGVAFALGEHETDVADRIKYLLQEEFGDLFRADCQPRGYETQRSSYVVCLSNKIVADFFKKWCGKYSWAKKMPEEAMWLPKKLQATILRNCISGDGCGKVTSRGYSLELKSKALIQQFLWISWRLGMSPVYKETGVLYNYTHCELKDGFEVYSDPNTGKKSRPGYLLRYTTRDSKNFNKICNFDDALMSKKASKKKTHIFGTEEGQWIVSKILSKKEEKTPCKVYNIEVEGDNSYIAEGVVVHNCEHVQIPELSKGKVIDVALREIPITKSPDGKDISTLYVDILIATNKSHTQLIDQIKTGEYNAVSMGCLIAYSQCSQCGNIAADEPQLCHHVRYYKNNFFHDQNGIRRIVAELCGRAEDPDSCKFIDASWVRKPAFGGAVLRNIVEPGEDVAEKIQTAIAVPSFQPQPGMMLRAASEAASTLMREIKAQEEGGEGADEGGGEAAPPGDDTDFPPAEDTADAPIGIDQPGAEGDQAAEPSPDQTGGEAAPEPQIQEPEEDATVKEVEDMMTKHILNKIRRKLLKDEVKERTKQEDRPTELASESRESIVREANDVKRVLEAARQHGNPKLVNGLMILSNLNNWKTFKKYGYSRDDVLALLSFSDRAISESPVSVDMVKAMSHIKTASVSPQRLFTEIIIETGQKPDAAQGKKLLKWAKILSEFE